jgi:ketosteroid isomerase-like protein
VTWWPVYAGLAASGDLGFTTGPYVSDGKRFGYYFTVWRRQPDGSWKWVLDAGPRHAAGSRLGRDTAPVFLPRSRTAGRAPQAAMPEVQALEAELARKAASDAHAAFAAVLADDALVMGSMVEPARGREASLVELGRRPATLALAPLGGGASGAGDLVWTYGDARWTEADHPRRGHAVRIWQRRDRGFVVVVDELLPVAEPPPR